MNNSHSKNIRWTPRKVAKSWQQRQEGIPTRKIAANLGTSPHNLRDVWKRFGYGSTKQIQEGELLEVSARIERGEKLLDIAEEMGKTYQNLYVQLFNRGLTTSSQVTWAEHIDHIIEARANGVSCISLANMIGTTPELVRQALADHRKRVGIKLKPIWTTELVEAAHALKISGKSFDEIADELNLVSGEAVRKKMRSAGHRYSTSTRWTHARCRSAQMRLRRCESIRVVALDNDVTPSHLRRVLKKKGLLP